MEVTPTVPQQASCPSKQRPRAPQRRRHLQLQRPRLVGAAQLADVHLNGHPHRVWVVIPYLYSDRAGTSRARVSVAHRCRGPGRDRHAQGDSLAWLPAERPSGVRGSVNWRPAVPLKAHLGLADRHPVVLSALPQLQHAQEGVALRQGVLLGKGRAGEGQANLAARCRGEGVGWAGRGGAPGAQRRSQGFASMLRRHGRQYGHRDSPHCAAQGSGHDSGSQLGRSAGRGLNRVPLPEWLAGCVA